MAARQIMTINLGIGDTYPLPEGSSFFLGTDSTGSWTYTDQNGVATSVDFTQNINIEFGIAFAAGNSTKPIITCTSGNVSLLILS